MSWPERINDNDDGSDVRHGARRAGWCVMAATWGRWYIAGPGALDLPSWRGKAAAERGRGYQSETQALNRAAYVAAFCRRHDLDMPRLIVGQVAR